jgi:hypothetical protein
MSTAPEAIFKKRLGIFSAFCLHFIVENREDIKRALTIKTGSFQGYPGRG